MLVMGWDSDMAIHLLAASSGRRRYRQSNRECASASLCGIGFMLFTVFGMAVLFSGSPSVFFPFDTSLAIIGLMLLILGVVLLRGSNRERDKVLEAVRGRDNVRLDVISAEAGVPIDRTRHHLTNLLSMKLIKGGIIDDVYSASMKAERVDSTTVRCPHCDTELELPDE